MSQAPGAVQLLKDATYIYGRSDAIPTATWARAVAVLARQSIERGLDDFWSVVEPTMSGQRNKRASFLCLGNYLPADHAADGYFSWIVLSRACHYQSYDVEPSATEVREWLAGAEKFLQRVGGAIASVTTTTSPSPIEGKAS